MYLLLLGVMNYAKRNGKFNYHQEKEHSASQMAQKGKAPACRLGDFKFNPKNWVLQVCPLRPPQLCDSMPVHIYVYTHTYTYMHMCTHTLFFKGKGNLHYEGYFK